MFRGRFGFLFPVFLAFFLAGHVLAGTALAKGKVVVPATEAVAGYVEVLIDDIGNGLPVAFYTAAQPIRVGYRPEVGTFVTLYAERDYVNRATGPPAGLSMAPAWRHT